MVKKTESATTNATPTPSKETKETKDSKKGDGATKKAAKSKATSTEPKAAANATAVSVNPPTEDSLDVTDSVSGSKAAAILLDMQAKLQNVYSCINTIRADMKTYARVSAKETKILEKGAGKKKKSTGTRSPSGFVKPTPISDELAVFLNKEKGIEMARTDVTREINAYVRAHSLQAPENKRKINADTKLSKLLKLEKGDELTYFNLQKYMSRHFPKTSGNANAGATNAVIAN